jgi:hypothetical protein
VLWLAPLIVNLGRPHAAHHIDCVAEHVREFSMDSNVLVIEAGKGHTDAGVLERVAKSSCTTCTAGTAPPIRLPSCCLRITRVTGVTSHSGLISAASKPKLRAFTRHVRAPSVLARAIVI